MDKKVPQHKAMAMGEKCCKKAGGAVKKNCGGEMKKKACGGEMKKKGGKC